MSWAVTINVAGGVTPDIEKAVADFLILEKKYHVKYVIEYASQRHMHLGVLDASKNLGKMLRGKLTKLYPDLMTHPLKAVRCRTWYKSGILKDDDDDTVMMADTHASWCDYMQKDGEEVHYSPGFPEEFQDRLADHKTKSKRRKQASWPAMARWEEQFQEHKLPYETRQDVSTGINKLAFVLRVASLPRASDMPGLVFNLHRYLNKVEGDVLDAMSRFSAECEDSRKRKRQDMIEEENEKYWQNQ